MEATPELVSQDHKAGGLRALQLANTGKSILGAVGPGSNAGPHFSVRQVHGDRSVRAGGWKAVGAGGRQSERNRLHYEGTVRGGLTARCYIRRRSLRSETLSDIQELRQEHAALVEIVGRLSAAVDAPESPPMVELFDLRRELSSTLTAHLKAEDWALYPRLMESGNPVISATAKSFSDEMGGLAAAFGVYTQRWDAMSIKGNWNGFCLETRDIIAALTMRITRENRDLYPLVDKLDQAA